MKCVEKNYGGRNCRIYGCENAEFLLVQPADGHDMQGMDRETAWMMEHAAAPFLLAAVPVEDWNRDLSPWPAPPVFGKEGFGDGAEDTLGFINEILLPGLRADHMLSLSAKTVIGGYSLAGLFALWAVHAGTGWDGAAAASPSVWFPGFVEYAKVHPPLCRAVYLSLGDREEKTRNPVMARVGGCIRSLHDGYGGISGMKTALEWNAGGHFQDPDLRTARAFCWIMEQLKNEELGMRN